MIVTINCDDSLRRFVFSEGRDNRKYLSAMGNAKRCYYR